MAAALAVTVAAVLAPGPGMAGRASGATDLLAGIDGAFEASGAGWTASGGTSSVVAGPVHGGSGAARVQSSAAGSIRLQSQYWLVPTSAGAAHTLTIWVLDNAPKVSLSVDVEFVSGGGSSVGLPSSVSVGGDSSAWRMVTVGPVTAPAGTVYARVAVRGTATGAGAVFLVDDAVLSRDDPPPTATATSAPTSTSTPVTTATVVATTVATPVPTTVPTAVPTVRPTPPAVRVFESLANGGFETITPLDGWRHAGGVASVIAPGFDGMGHAALLVSESDSTKWLYQTVMVEPGGWYAGRAS